ncbi:outer membrane immunogenic protein [Paenochrobactrum gallinarii]|uniref:Outer membrane immunogenic protein n=1 Tax=Paenochrobactrum gallinarii TaxID=643673 RepID=A0A841LSP1_9HYPH|nr:outer membrane protein [Paenochrobactrum gallinarii]MBB6261225.1 outer membrane immunogenic protein [Paenochrobactrum gallinarii]
MKKLLVAATILVSTSYAAHAADVIMHHEMVPVVMNTGHSWTGGYLGFETGYQNARFKEHFNGVHHLSQKSDGLLGGIYGGYNFEFRNRMILGVDANLTYNSARQNNAYSMLVNTNTTSNFNHESKLEWSAALRARLGFAMDRWMPYIAGGVATAQIKNSIYDANYNYQSDRNNMTGWTAGAGVDYALASNTTLRLEYRHTDYGRKTFAIDNFTYKTKVKTDEFRIGVAYRF